MDPETMSMLNRRFPFIRTYTTNEVDYFLGDETPTIGLAMLHEFSKTNNFWYCAITTDTSLGYFSIVDMMEPVHLEMIKSKEAFLVIDLSFEPFLDAIDSVYYHVVVKHDIPSSQVIFMSNMYDAPNYNKMIAERLALDPINIFYFSALEQTLHAELESRRVSANHISLKQFDKKFLNLNRRWRKHRPLLTALLYSKNLIEKGHISFGPCESFRGWDQVWEYLKSSASNNAEMSDLLDNATGVKTMPWLYLDVDELDTNRAVTEDSINKFYEDTYFSVVSETTFYNSEETRNSRFLTEKTFKAIAMKHPFILVSIPGSLELLKQLGYKTFHPYIDESYDRELDDNKRMMMILKEVERLANLTYDELATFLHHVNHICRHNHVTLLRKRNFIFDQTNGGQIV